MRRTARYAVAMGALVLLGATAVGAQGPAGLDSATIAAIRPIVERVRAANLPVDLLYSKARQGQVQRLPVAKIEAAVRVVAERIQIASRELAPNPTEQELSAAADALQSGVPRETLREMRLAAKDASLAVPLGILTTLVQRGVSVEKASVQVVALLQRGAAPQHFIALGERVREDVLAGKQPDASLDLRLKGIFPNLPSPATTTGDFGIQNATPRRPR